MNRSTFLRETLPAAAIATAVGAGFFATSTPSVDAAEQDSPEVAELRDLLRKLDKAFDQQDLDGVLVCYADLPRTLLMGTGPGEYWVGKEAIAEAYAEMFKDFDVGSHTFEYKLRRGNIGTDMAYLSTAGLVTCNVDGEPHEYVLNITLVAEKVDGEWKIVNHHYSNLTGEDIVMREE